MAYLDFAKAYYRKNGQPTSELHAIKRTIRKLSDIYGDLDIYDFSPKKLKALQASWVKDDIARSTVNRYAGIAKRIFKWGVEEELVAPEVYQAIATVRGIPKGRSMARETSPVEPVDEKIVIDMLAHLPHECRDIISLQLTTACRPGEALAMRPMDIDRSEDPWAYTVHSHKTEHHGQRRVIYLNRVAQGIITPYLLGSPNKTLLQSLPRCCCVSSLHSAYLRPAEDSEVVTESIATHERHKHPREVRIGSGTSCHGSFQNEHD